MPSAYVDAASIRFPPKCPHCGRPEETTRPIAAMRNLDILFGEYVPPPTIAVPVCADAAKRRRRIGIAAFALTTGFILLAGFLATMLAIDERWIAATLLAAAIAVVAVGGRVGWDDALLDRRQLGVAVRRAPGNRVRMWFTRDDYFSEWAAMNPSASVDSGVVGWRPRKTVAAPGPAPSFDRKLPAIALAILAAVLALHHFNAVSGGHVFLTGSSILMGLAFLAAGGIVYPPVFWSMGIYAKDLPLWVKVIGAVLAIAGALTGFVLGISYTHA